MSVPPVDPENFHAIPQVHPINVPPTIAKTIINHGLSTLICSAVWYLNIVESIKKLANGLIKNNDPKAACTTKNKVVLYKYFLDLIFFQKNINNGMFSARYIIVIYLLKKVHINEKTKTIDINPDGNMAAKDIKKFIVIEETIAAKIIIV